MYLYHTWVEDKDLVNFHLELGQSHLFIRAQRPLRQEARASLDFYRRQLQEYIKADPAFKSSLVPYSVAGQAPAIVREMSAVSFSAGVGPLAAVAGAIAEYLGRDLLKDSPEVIIENGGDIFLKSNRVRKVGIFAGSSALSGKLAFEVAAGKSWGICTSSGTVGPSLSFGRADAAVVISRSAVFSDAWATRLANEVSQAEDIEPALELVRDNPEAKGAIIIVGDKLGIWGDIKLIRR